jgi:hypothetical protein
MAEAKRTPLDKVMTPEGIAKFPVLNVPDTKFNPEGDFKCGIILSAAEGAPLYRRLQAAAQKMFDATFAELTEKVATEKGEKKAKAKKALEELKLGDLPAKPVYDEDGNETGDLAFNFKMKATYKDKSGATKSRKPSLFDAAGDVFPSSTAIWGGSKVKVAGSINSFYMPGTNTAGVGLRLSAVQVIQLCTAGGGGNASSFGFGKEDGYTVDKSAAEEAGFDKEDGDSSADDDTDF